MPTVDVPHAKRRLEREQATQDSELTMEDVDMSPSPSPSVDSESIASESSTASKPSISQPEHKQSQSNKHRAAKKKEEGTKGRNLQFQAITVMCDCAEFSHITYNLGEFHKANVEICL